MADASLTTTQLAEQLGVAPSTVRVWIWRGVMRPDARTPGGHARFRPSTVDKIRRRMRAAAAA